MTPPDLLSDRLACPACRLPVRWGNGIVTCTGCSRVFPIRDGVPFMLDDDSRSAFSDRMAMAENAQLRERLSRHGWLLRALQVIRPPHPFLFTKGRRNREIFSSMLTLGGGQPVTLDIGSGISGKTNVSGLSPSVLSGRIGLEIGNSPTAHVVGDAHRLPFLDGKVDGVMIQGVLEHVVDPVCIVNEIYRVLRPGGAIYADVPFLQHYHQDPEDYRRFTLPGLRQLFTRFEETDAGVSAGPSSALCDLLTEYPAVWFNNPIFYWGTKWILGWFVLPIRCLDYIFAGRSRSASLAGAFYFLGQKQRGIADGAS